MGHSVEQLPETTHSQNNQTGQINPRNLKYDSGPNGQTVYRIPTFRPAIGIRRFHLSQTAYFRAVDRRRSSCGS